MDRERSPLLSSMRKAYHALKLREPFRFSREYCETHPKIKSKDEPATGDAPYFAAVPSAYQQAGKPGSGTTTTHAGRTPERSNTAHRPASVNRRARKETKHNAPGPCSGPGCCSREREPSFAIFWNPRLAHICKCATAAMHTGPCVHSSSCTSNETQPWLGQSEVATHHNKRLLCEPAQPARNRVPWHQSSCTLMKSFADLADDLSLPPAHRAW